MISEINHWRRDLERSASDLKRRQSQRVWRAGSYAALERALIYGFYSARKLIESRWVSPDLKKEQVHVTAFPSLGKTMHWMFWPELEEYFDLTSPTRQTLPLWSVCNQIVHSFVLTPAFYSGRLCGIYFCSYEKSDQVFRADVAQLAQLLYKAARSWKSLGVKFGPEVNRIDEDRCGVLVNP